MTDRIASSSRSARDLGRRFAHRFGSRPRIYFAPGRANLIGAHVDYNGGTVLPVPIGLGTFVAIARRDDERIRCASVNETDAFELDTSAQPPAAAIGWCAYVYGMLDAGRERGFQVGGFDALISGNLPRRAGLASSASLEIAAGRALASTFGWDLSQTVLADLAWQVETRYIGLQCGIMDPYAIALAQDMHALRLDCDTKNWAHLAFPRDCELVVLDTRRPRELVRSAYNERVTECSRALESLNAAARRTETRLAAYGADDVTRHADALDATSLRRARHVTTECERVRLSIAALDRHDLVQLGLQLDASHRSCRLDYEVSCAELDFLVTRTRAVEGVLGARMTGAGFGGCAIALQRPLAMTSAKWAEIANDYEATFGFSPAMHVVSVDAGSREIVLPED